MFKESTLLYCSVFLVEANLEGKHNTNTYGRDGCEKLVQKVQKKNEDKSEKLYRYYGNYRRAVISNVFFTKLPRNVPFKLH